MNVYVDKSKVSLENYGAKSIVHGRNRSSVSRNFTLLENTQLLNYFHFLNLAYSGILRNYSLALSLTSLFSNYESVEEGSIQGNAGNKLAVNFLVYHTWVIHPPQRGHAWQHVIYSDIMSIRPLSHYTNFNKKCAEIYVLILLGDFCNQFLTLLDTSWRFLNGRKDQELLKIRVTCSKNLWLFDQSCPFLNTSWSFLTTSQRLLDGFSIILD